MDKNNEHKITNEDLLNVFNAENETAKETEKSEEGSKKEETIINAFTKSPEGSVETLEYLKDKEHKIEEKLETESDEKKKENLRRMLAEVTEIIDKLPDIKINKKVPEKEEEKASSQASNKVLSMFTRVEPTVRTEKATYEGSKKAVPEDLPMELPPISGLVDEENILPLPDDDFPKLPEIEGEKTQKEFSRKVENTNKEKTVSEIKKEKAQERELQKFLERQEEWRIRKEAFKERLTQIKPLELKIKPVILKDYKKESTLRELTQEELKEGLFEELKKKNVVIVSSAIDYIKSEDFVLNNNEEDVKLVAVNSQSVNLPSNEVTLNNMFDLTQSLGLLPCPDGTILELSAKIKELKLDKTNILVFTKDYNIFSLKYDPEIRKRVIELAKDSDITPDTRCFLQIKQ